MGRLDSAIDFINKKIDSVRKDINDGLKFCGIIDEAPPAPIQQTPKHNSAKEKTEKPEITKAEPEKAPQKDAATKKPACLYGECCEYNIYLYHTCDKSVTCPNGLKKQYYGRLKTPGDDRVFGFIKQFAKLGPKDSYEKEAILRDRYVSTFFPNLKPLRVFIMGILEINETYDPEISPFIKFLFELNEKNVSYPNLAANVETLYKIYSEQKYKERGYVIEKLFDTPSPLLRDPTLFARDNEEFRYSYGALEMFSDKAALTEYFKGPPQVNIDMLFDENGKLKPAGIGGPEIGETEDGIWNLLQQF